MIKRKKVSRSSVRVVCCVAIMVMETRHLRRHLIFSRLLLRLGRMQRSTQKCQREETLRPSSQFLERAIGDERRLDDNSILWEFVPLCNYNDYPPGSFFWSRLPLPALRPTFSFDVRASEGISGSK